MVWLLARQTVETQDSLGRSATCAQPLPAQPGDEPAPTAKDRRRVRRQHSGQTESGQISAPTGTVVGSDVTAEQSAAMTAPSSVFPDVSAGAEGEASQLFSSEQEATLLDCPSGTSTESDEETLSAPVAAGTFTIKMI